MIKKADYEFLKSNYGDVASWTIWDKADKKSKNVDGYDWCSDEDALIQRVNGKYVFVAMNPYSKELKMGKVKTHKSGNPWRSNFHSKWPKRDCFLRYATAGTEMEGSYITDLIKDVKTPNGSVLKKKMKEDSSILSRNIEEFKEEISHLSDKPIIIALGDDVYGWLKSLYDEYKVIRMTHYSLKGLSYDLYREEALNIIKSCK